MEANTIIKNNFFELLTSIGFSITEDNKNLVCFKSDNVTIRFNYIPYEYVYIYFIKLNNCKTEYENFLVEEYLQIPNELSVAGDSQEDEFVKWMKHVLSYFEKFQNTLLIGDKDFYSKLHQYYEIRQIEYNKKWYSARK